MGWIKLDSDHPGYGQFQYVADAIAAADEYVDYASFDADHDGELATDELHIAVIAAGYEVAYSPTNSCAPFVGGGGLKLQMWDVTAPVADGVEVGASVMTAGESNCDKDDRWGVPAHTSSIGPLVQGLGLDIGWPDLFFPFEGSGLGPWSVMSYGAWRYVPGTGQVRGDSPSLPDAWSKWYQGWITPTEVTTKTDDVQVPVGGAVLVSPNPGGVDWQLENHSGTGEYFLVENRQQQGYDASLPGCGLLVYRIDETIRKGPFYAVRWDDPLVKVLQADGSDSLRSPDVLLDEDALAGDPYPGPSGNHELSDDTNPSARFHTGEASGLKLHVDSDDCADTMQIDVTPGRASPPGGAAGQRQLYGSPRGDRGCSLSQSTDNASSEPSEPTPAGTGEALVWFRWTAPATGELTLSTRDSRSDTVLGLYTGSAVGALTEVAANDNEDAASYLYTSRITARVRAGVTYAIAAGGFYEETGPLELTWDFEADPVTPPTPTVTVTPTPKPTPTPTPTATPTPTPAATPAPANDRFAAPAGLSGKRGTRSGTTVGAGLESGEHVFRAAGSGSVWFTWRAKKSGTVTFQADADFAPLLAVATGRRLAKLELLVSDTTGSLARVRVKVEKGATYRVVLDGRRGAAGAYALSWKSRSK